jgi:hypothetical protein
MTNYHAETIESVKRIIDSLILSQERIRLFYGDTKTGISWNEENDNMGRISRSMGPHKIPILVFNSRARGGSGILDHCIVGILGKGPRFLYRHPGLNFGKWSIGDPISPGYVSAVFRNGELFAQFRKPGQGARFIEFMKGERFAK